jgi:hypothetical protein
MKPILAIDTTTKMTVVFGRLSKFKNGPSIVSRSPITLEIKNLGNRSTFSQKSGILNTNVYNFRYILFCKKFIILKYC